MKGEGGEPQSWADTVMSPVWVWGNVKLDERKREGQKEGRCQSQGGARSFKRSRAPRLVNRRQHAPTLK